MWVTPLNFYWDFDRLPNSAVQISKAESFSSRSWIGVELQPVYRPRRPRNFSQSVQGENATDLSSCIPTRLGCAIRQCVTPPQSGGHALDSQCPLLGVKRT